MTLRSVLTRATDAALTRAMCAELAGLRLSCWAWGLLADALLLLERRVGRDA